MASRCFFTTWAILLHCMALVFSMNSAPLLPPYFTTEWKLYNIRRTDVSPPFPDEPPLPYSAGRGRTFYDDTTDNIIEVYTDFCVPIFVNGSDWQCHFLNTGGAAYLISLTKSPYPPCCVFGKPWAPPHRNMTSNMKFELSSTLYGKPVDWYVMRCDSGACPFWYGFYRDMLPGGYRLPAVFAFPGWEGWATQRFFNFRVEKPDPTVFNIPSSCNNAKDCGYL